jgi:hypothetical protein
LSAQSAKSWVKPSIDGTHSVARGKKIANEMFVLTSKVNEQDEGHSFFTPKPGDTVQACRPVVHKSGRFSNGLR